MGTTTRLDQQSAFDLKFGETDRSGRVTDDPLASVYLRRMRIAVDHTLDLLGEDPARLTALTLCGGIGGEASYLADRGFASVTNSDFSERALEESKTRDPRLSVRQIDVESNDVSDGAYDVVLVHDGLHHLLRPVSGFNEMIRIAAKAVVVVEPHLGLVGRLIGTDWETVGGTTNYVFRWDRNLFAQTARSQLVRDPTAIRTTRLWDHNQQVLKLSSWTDVASVRVLVSRLVYAGLTPFNRFGNNFIGVLVK